MRLVDHDQPEPGIGQEQGRARADHDLGLARDDGPPGPPPLGRLEGRVPQHRRHAEAVLEAAQEVLGQRDLGEQDQHLPAALQRGGDPLEIAFGLARSGHAVEQEGPEAAGLDRRDEAVGRRLLVRRKVGRGEVRPGAGIGAVEVDRHRLQQSGADHAAQHAFGNAGDLGQLADRRLLALERVERRRALGGKPRRRVFEFIWLGSGQPIFGRRAPAAQGGAARQRHTGDGGQRRAIVVGGPLDQAAQGGGERGNRQHLDQRAQARIRNLDRGQPFRFPDDADDLARSERGHDHRSGLDRHPFGHAIIERSERRVENKESNSGHRPCI